MRIHQEIIEAIDRKKAFYKTSLVEVINQLIKEGDVFTCAGGFQAENELMQQHVDHMEGGVDSFKGMPVEVVKRLLDDAR